MNTKLYIIVTIAVIILIVAITFLIKDSKHRQSDSTISSQVTQQEQKSQQPIEQELQQTIEPETIQPETIQPIEQAIQSDGLQQDTTVHEPNLREDQMTPLDRELIEAGAMIPPMGNIDVNRPAPQSIYSNN